MLKIIDVIQGTEPWLLYKAGRVSGTRVGDIIAKTRSSGPSASRNNCKSVVAIERLTKKPVSIFQTSAMLDGIKREPEARSGYSLINGDVEEVGIIQHPTLEWCCSSPDGLVENRTGAIEIKCPQHSAHMETLLADEVPSKYIPQIQWLMACSGDQIKYVDYVSYQPDYPAELQLYIKRVHRDDGYISDLTKEVIKFLDEVAETVEALRNKYSIREAA